MQVAGYIGYAILIFFALSWALGVRVKRDIILPTVMGSLFFTSSALTLWVFEVDKIHSWWLLPAGFIFSFLCNIILVSRLPLLFETVRFTGSAYAGLLQIGRR